MNQKIRIISNRLKIEPVFDGVSTAVSQYKVTDNLGVLWMMGSIEECNSYLGVTNVEYHTCKVCGQSFNNYEDYYYHYDIEHN